MKIKSNYQPRDLLYWNELTEKEKAEFNFSGKETSSYFRYKGNVYCLGDIMRIGESSPFPEYWEGYLSESFFSGILIRFCDKDYGSEGIIVGTYTE